MQKRLRRGLGAAFLARKRGFPTTSATNKPRPRLQVVREGKNAREKAGKSIFILKSALTKKLPLELNYRDPRRPALCVTPRIPGPSRSSSIRENQSREL
jgi:hypothetical protein